MAEAGASLLTADIEEERGEETAEAAKERGSDAIFMKVDVTHTAQIARMVSRAAEKFGRMDVFVNNGGVVLG